VCILFSRFVNNFQKWDNMLLPLTNISSVIFQNLWQALRQNGTRKKR
jgi:hypothetical protein